MKKMLQKLESNKHEIAARLFLIAIFVLFPLLADAQEANLRKDAKAVRDTIITGIVIVGSVAAVVMCGFHGLMYMIKPANERGEEDARKLKSNIIRIVVGFAIIMAAASIGTFVVTSLGGVAL